MVLMSHVTVKHYLHTKSVLLAFIKSGIILVYMRKSEQIHVTLCFNLVNVLSPCYIGRCTLECYVRLVNRCDLTLKASKVKIYPTHPMSSLNLLLPVTIIIFNISFKINIGISVNCVLAIIDLSPQCSRYCLHIPHELNSYRSLIQPFALNICK
jgi:hypothetical protein